MATQKTIAVGRPYYFVPRHTEGDNEFKGHGPDVNVSARVYAANDKLNARIYMKARETQEDWTTAEDEIDLVLYEAERVIGLAPGQTDSSSWSYTDNNEEADASPIMSEGEPVRQFICVGDTQGEDAGVNTSVTVYFRPIRILVEP
jgi:hypothetical protein